MNGINNQSGPTFIVNPMTGLLNQIPQTFTINIPTPPNPTPSAQNGIPANGAGSAESGNDNGQNVKGDTTAGPVLDGQGKPVLDGQGKPLMKKKPMNRKRLIIIIAIIIGIILLLGSIGLGVILIVRSRNKDTATA